MGRRTSLLASVCAVACVARTADSGSEEGSSSSAAGPSSATTVDGGTSAETSSSPTSAESSSGSSEPVESSDSSEPSESTGAEECVEGIFVGRYSGYFEYFEFAPCDGSEPAWFLPGNDYLECLDAWITIDGWRCGPGAYGHLGYYFYEMGGEVIEGPCDVSCGVDPSPEQCGTFDQVCAKPTCDPVEPDCDAGQRCVPSSFSGLPPWTASECVADGVQPLGAACTSTAPWTDDCAQGGYCHEGVCAAVCDDDADCAVGEQCRICEIGNTGNYDLYVGVCSADELAC